MAEPFLSEIRMMSFGFAPKGWALCDGQLLPINQNQPLFSLLGTTYGGDGRVNFGLPNLQGRIPIHMGSGHTLGERGGEQAHTLSISELPTHTHTMQGSSTNGDQPVPTGALPPPGASHQGNGFILAETGGAEEITLTVNQMPAHSHPFLASTNFASQGSPAGNLVAQPTVVQLYFQSPGAVALSANSVGATGGSQPHTNF